YFLSSPWPVGRLIIQRPQSPGCELCVFTSGSTCQQRTHFSPSAAETFTLSPSRSEASPCVASNSFTITCEVISTKRNSSSRRSSTVFSSAVAHSSTFADRFEPTVLAPRAVSINLFTADFTAIRVSHSASVITLAVDATGMSYHLVVNTYFSDCSGISGHASCAVKLRIGAIQRTKACTR